jgi:glycosyltransferase involved in cell wall biosynthesis
MKKKITFVLSTLTGGGAERVTLNIISLLDKDKFDINLIVLQEYGEYLAQIPKDITLHILHVKRTLFSVFALRKKIQHIKPDIVYATLFHTNIALYASIMGLREKPKIVLRNPTSPKRIIEAGEISFFYRKALQKVYNNVNMVIAQTPEMKNEIAHYFNVNKDKIEVFINPLDTDKINRLTHNIKNPFDKKHINIVAAGRLSYEKGFDVLIQSFSEIVKTDQRFFLHIIGKDEGEYENLFSQIKTLSLDKYVKLWGFQQNPYKFFKYCDLYVLSSRIEGLPNTVLESLYLGKPVVATRCIPFMDTLVSEGNNGYIVDIENVEALKNAILKYDELNINHIKLDLDFGEPNKLFTNIV